MEQISHSYKGTTWKKHKYISRKVGKSGRRVYTYKENFRTQVGSSTYESGGIRPDRFLATTVSSERAQQFRIPHKNPNRQEKKYEQSTKTDTLKESFQRTGRSLITDSKELAQKGLNILNESVQKLYETPVYNNTIVSVDGIGKIGSYESQYTLKKTGVIADVAEKASDFLTSLSDMIGNITIGKSKTKAKRSV